MTRSRSAGGCFSRIVAVLLLLALIAAGAAYISLTTPYKAFDQAVVLEFPKGTSTQSMGRKLADAGVIH
jgi:cell division protein YceG involved in septum cleavage